MRTDVNNADNFCFDSAYSTTRLLTRETPFIETPPDARFKTMLFLPKGEGRIGEGGLRVQGYFKKSLPDKPLITVITVVFNGEKHLEETILSVLNQTYDNIEYNIIDGGSTDGTIDLIKKYGGQIDYWVSEKDSGIYDAMNKAVSLALGDWIYVIGSDDKLYEDALSDVSPYLKSQDTVYYGNVKLLTKGSIFAGPFSAYKMMYYNISHQSIFYPKSFYANNRYNTKYRSAADFELLMRCHGSRKFEIKYVPVLVAEYNDTDGISSKQEDAAFLADRKELVKKNFSFANYLVYAIRYYLVLIMKLLGIKEIIKTMTTRIVK